MKTFEPLIIGIAEGFRNHPLPNLPFFKLVPFADKEELAKADIFVQNNILEQKRKKMIPYYKYILDSGKPYLCTEASIFRKNMVAQAILKRIIGGVGLVISVTKETTIMIIVQMIDGCEFKKNSV